MELLNEELLIWAGFVKADIKKAYYWVRCDRKAKWIAPGQTGYQRPDKPPNFVNDIDACFKWLAPKLYYWKIESNYGKPKAVAIMRDPNIKYGFFRFRGEAVAETSAIAFTQAIKNSGCLKLPTS